ncbi:hypothetical protein Godav_004718, partial [Gossypium davidsonii]|nr:hypothetical protein [Gossypium davidsonii]
ESSQCHSECVTRALREWVGENVTGRSSKPVTVAPNAFNGGLLDDGDLQLGDIYIINLQICDSNSTKIMVARDEKDQSVERKDICWKDCKCLGVEAEKDLGCRFLLGHYEEGVLDGLSFQLIIHNCPKSENLDIDFNLYGNGSNDHSTAFHSVLFEKYLLDLMASEDASDVSELQTGNNGLNLNIYTAGLIMSATNGFSPDNLLGKEIAIKRLSSGSSQGLLEFKKDLILIAKLQDTNLVRLLGFCVQGEEKMLVYEYMPNKSLDTFIFDDSKMKLLNWVKRFSIIEGITQGLFYLHKYSRLRIIHRDLKLSNILLDENMNPKISDFGLAKIYTKRMKLDQIRNRLSAHSKYTPPMNSCNGYTSPEYAMEGIFSEKSDVYTFGVMVLKVVSGQKNSSHFEFDRPLNLAWELWKHGGALELMDPALSDSCFKQYQVLRCITLSLLCVEDNPLDRPTMSDVISVLNGEMQLALPKQPAFSTGIRIVETNIESKEVEIYSLNGLTMSTMDGR